MEALYTRKSELETEIKRLQRDCFNPQVKPLLNELRARYSELSNAIRTIEHTL